MYNFNVCTSCSMVCNIVFCSEFPRLAESQEEEHGQLQSAMRFTQTHKTIARKRS